MNAFHLCNLLLVCQIGSCQHAQLSNLPYVSPMAMSNNVTFGPNWPSRWKHGLVQVLNRSPEDLKRSTSATQLAAKESKFFQSQSKLRRMPDEARGLPALISKLTKVQAERIMEYVPILKSKVSSHLLSSATLLIKRACKHKHICPVCRQSMSCVRIHSWHGGSCPFYGHCF